MLIILLLPVLTGVIGNREPYGNRTGLVLTVFVPVTAFVAVKMQRAARRSLGVLALPTIIVFVAASTIVARTRFMLTTYAFATVCVVIALEWVRRTANRHVSAVAN